MNAREHTNPRRYRLYGVTIESVFSFDSPLPVAAPESVPDLRFQLADHPVATGPHADVDRPIDEVETTVSVPGVARYSIGERSITATPSNDADAGMVEIHFLSTAMSTWLDRRQVLALHASVVVVAGTAIAFLASNRGGKSGLAAAFMQADHALLSDDLLAVTFGDDGTPTAAAGYPQMRMWDDSARNFIGDGWQRLPLVHAGYPKRRVVIGSGGWGRFHGDAVELKALFLPDRGATAADGAPMLGDPIAPSAAVMEVVRHSLGGGGIEAAIRPGRLARLARLVERVPVRRVAYPDGYEHLDQVRDVLERELAKKDIALKAVR